MSASSQKKLRKAARESGNDKKLLAQQEAAAKKAKSKRDWTIGIVAVVLVCAVIIVLGSGVLNKTTAMTIGDEKYSVADVNYYVGNQFQNFVNQYGNYASLFGLDTSLGVSSLSDQECLMMAEGGTWKDYFLTTAVSDMIKIQALCEYAEENGIELTEEEINSVESSIAQNEALVPYMGYNSVPSFYALNYGQGVNSEVMREHSLRGTLANKVLEHYNSELVYTDAELQLKYNSYKGEQDLIKYAYMYIAAETETVTAEDGSQTTQVSEDSRKAAQAQAAAILEAYKAGDAEDVIERFKIAAEVYEGGSPVAQLTNAASVSSVYRDWLLEKHEAGDIEIIENNSNGFYVVVFAERSDNNYNVAKVRHILVKAVADENGVYTDEAKATALASAESILADWKAGEATESSFATMANLLSEDENSNTKGGLYDGVIKGQTVEEFDAFCFAEHEEGDTAIVYGESDTYAGYHIMYYIGQGDLYRNIIARNDLASTAIDEWLSGLTAQFTRSNGFGLRFVA